MVTNVDEFKGRQQYKGGDEEKEKEGEEGTDDEDDEEAAAAEAKEEDKEEPVMPSGVHLMDGKLELDEDNKVSEIYHKSVQNDAFIMWLIYIQMNFFIDLSNNTNESTAATVKIWNDTLLEFVELELKASIMADRLKEHFAPIFSNP